MIPHEGKGIVAGKPALDGVHPPGRTTQPQRIPPPRLHRPVQTPQVRQHRLQVRLTSPPAAEQGGPAKGHVGVAVPRDLVSARKQPGDQLRAVDYAAPDVLAEIGEVVEGQTVPAGGPGLSRAVRIVPRGVTHHAEGPAGPKMLQDLRQHQGQGLPPETVRQGRQTAGTIIEGDGADPLLRRHPVHPAHRGETDWLRLGPPSLPV